MDPRCFAATEADAAAPRFGLKIQSLVPKTRSHATERLSCAPLFLGRMQRQQLDRTGLHLLEDVDESSGLRRGPVRYEQRRSCR
jgi:hypothetical protein